MPDLMLCRKNDVHCCGCYAQTTVMKPHLSAYNKYRQSVLWVQRNTYTIISWTAGATIASFTPCVLQNVLNHWNGEFSPYNANVRHKFFCRNWSLSFHQHLLVYTLMKSVRWSVLKFYVSAIIDLPSVRIKTLNILQNQYRRQYTDDACVPRVASNHWWRSANRCFQRLRNEFRKL